MGTNRQQYIHNFARTLMGKLGIQGAVSYLNCETRKELARALVKDHWLSIIEHLSKEQSDATCGRLAACGLGTDLHHKAEAWPSGAFTILDIVGSEHP